MLSSSMQPLLLLSITTLKPHIIGRHARRIHRLLFHHTTAILNLCSSTTLSLDPAARHPIRSCHLHPLPSPHRILLVPHGRSTTNTAAVHVGGTGGEGTVFGFVFELLLRHVPRHLFRCRWRRLNPHILRVISTHSMVH